MIKVQAPGRVNLIGEHTDYNDGFVLPAAIDKKTTVWLEPNGSPMDCRVRSRDLDDAFSFSLAGVHPLPDHHWGNYVMGVVDELQKLGGTIAGFNLELTSNVPIGGGLSSSAALECSVAVALNEQFDLGFAPMQLIKAAQRAENDFVGMKCGIMDQFASMMGQAGQVLLLDCRTLDYQYFPLDLHDHELLLLNTNVSHALAASEYNTRRAECEAGVTVLQRAFPQVRMLRDAGPEQLETVRPQLSGVLYRRCRHVISENQRVLRATEALRQGDLRRLGELIYRSHESLRRDYEVSCPELDFLVDHARQHDFILGARMVGGGFGGCTLHLIEKERRAGYVEKTAAAYREAFGIELTPYVVAAEAGARIVPAVH